MIFQANSISRRGLLAATAATLALPRAARAAERKTLSLELLPAALDVGQEQPIAGWKLSAVALPRLVRGDVVEVTVRNSSSVAVTFGWRGLDGAPELQPWLARAPTPAGESAAFAVALRHAGTLFCEAHTINGMRVAAFPLVVTESPAVAVDADETLLIEAWSHEKSGALIYSVNQRRKPLDIEVAANSRLRLRFISASRHSIFAMRLPGLTPIVVALDSQPCEPFAARDARVVLAPGTRIDVVVDAIGTPGTEFPLMLEDSSQSIVAAKLTITGNAPVRSTVLTFPGALPSNGLPERLALAAAMRIDLRLDDPSAWIAPAAMSAAVAPLFTVKRGRTVVLALGNPGDRAIVFHLNGHHARLLDRLDDGWKPFWLDTLAVPARQTLRLAFVAEHIGSYLLETSALEPEISVRLRSYRVLL